KERDPRKEPDKLFETMSIDDDLEKTRSYYPILFFSLKNNEVCNQRLAAKRGQILRYPERKLLSVPVEDDWDNVPDATVISSSPLSIVDPNGHVDFVATERSVFDLSFTRLHQL
nr:hypothetical protein [Tanacetum cinerariifolium]